MNNSLPNEINELEFIDNERGYWFVRTDNGINFDTYYENGFIGIGWNDITLEDLTKLSVNDVQAKIAKNNNYDLQLARGKSKVTGIYNKLIRFKDIKKGDVIMMPSYGSGRLAFGIVEDSNVYVELEKTGDCEYYKRKKIDWKTVKNIKSLDSKFYEIKLTRHAISNVKTYENYIDRVISTFYFKANTGNFVFEVNKKEDINLSHLLELIGTIKSLIADINSYYDYNENIEESVIKLSLQSEGLFALKVPTGKSLATLGLILSLSSCGDKTTGTVEQQKFIESHQMKLDTISRRMDDLEIDKDKINQAFK
jgi:hypothetical protein